MTKAEQKARDPGEALWPLKVPRKLYYKIGEVCSITGIPAHVLRFWEKQFPQLCPNKTHSGHRLYKKRDILVALRIKELLYEKKFTIRGARECLASETGPAKRPEGDEMGARLGRLKEGLLELKARLERSPLP